VAEQRALRLGRGARGVHDDGGVADLDQLATALEVAARYGVPGGAETGLGGEAGQVAVAEDDDLLQVGRIRECQTGAVLLLQTRERLGQHGREVRCASRVRVGCGGDQDPHLGVAGQVGQLQALVARVHGDRVQPGLGRAEQGGDDVGAVRQQDPDRVPGPEASRHQAPGEEVGPGGQPGVADLVVGEHQGQVLAVLGGPEIEQIPERRDLDPMDTRFGHGTAPLVRPASPPC
jgi:hypothetical protein